MLMRMRALIARLPFGALPLLAAVILAAVVGQACLGGGDSVPSGILELVPEDSQVVRVLYIDQIISGEAPDWFADSIEDEWDDYLDDLGAFLDDLTTLTVAAGEDGLLVVLDGGIDFEQARDYLDDEDFDDDTYRGYELWEGWDGWYEAVSLLEGRGQIVTGSTEGIKGALRAIDEGSGSLLDDVDNDMGRALKKAGAGWLRYAEEGCLFYDLRGCRAFAMSVRRGDEEDLVEIITAFLFRSDQTAESQMYDLEDQFVDGTSLGSYDIEDVRTDGEFVIMTIVGEEDDLTGDLLPY